MMLRRSVAMNSGSGVVDQGEQTFGKGIARLVVGDEVVLELEDD